MTVLHKVFRFCAAHRYHNPRMTEEENQAVFGEDTRLHGHNYRLTVSVTGPVDPATGFLADLGRLKRIVEERVLRQVDHRRIDTEITWFDDRRPSTENLARWIWEQVEPELRDCRLWRIRLQETDSIYTDYFGGESSAPGKS